MKQFGQLVISAAATGSLLIGATTLHAAASVDDLTAFQQTNLVSNVNGQAATIDPRLQNPWGAAWSPGGPLWTSDNNDGLSTLYTGAGTIVPFAVTIPPVGGAKTANPDGIVWNPNDMTDFIIPGAKVGAVFIFDGEDGSITAWNPVAAPMVAGASMASLVVDNSATAVYKGLAYGTNTHGNFIFATNFRAATVEAYNVNFKLITLDGSFTDPDIPAGFAPFGIANVDGDLFVTYAQQDAAKHDPVTGDGLGFVDVFSTDGVFIRRFASQGALNAPWGVVRATEGFGSAAGAILIGNFGNNGHFGGWINTFGSDGTPLGELRSPQGQSISIDGLWSLYFGGFAGSDGDTLYFTAGPNNQMDGLIGKITAVSPAGTTALH